MKPPTSSVLALPIFLSRCRITQAVQFAWATNNTLGSRQCATNHHLWNDDPKKDPGQSTMPLDLKVHRQLGSTSGVWDCLHSWAGWRVAKCQKVPALKFESKHMVPKMCRKPQEELLIRQPKTWPKYLSSQVAIWYAIQKKYTLTS